MSICIANSLIPFARQSISLLFQTNDFSLFFIITWFTLSRTSYKLNNTIGNLVLYAPSTLIKTFILGFIYISDKFLLIANSMQLYEYKEICHCCLAMLHICHFLNSQTHDLSTWIFQVQSLGAFHFYKITTQMYNC